VSAGGVTLDPRHTMAKAEARVRRKGEVTGMVRQ
jgi:hypothetical protein